MLLIFMLLGIVLITIVILVRIVVKAMRKKKDIKSEIDKIGEENQKEL